MISILNKIGDDRPLDKAIAFVMDGIREDEKPSKKMTRVGHVGCDWFLEDDRPREPGFQTKSPSDTIMIPPQERNWFSFHDRIFMSLITSNSSFYFVHHVIRPIHAAKAVQASFFDANSGDRG